MPGATNVLVLSDNAQLYTAFRSIAKDVALEGVSFRYAYSAGRFTSPLREEPGLLGLDVKRDVARIVDEFDLVISAHCKQLFPEAMVRGVRCVNVHPGLNPYNRGWFPQVFSILNGMPLGATIHEIDAELDHGPIIAQKQIPVHPWDTSKTAYDRVLEAEFDLLREHLASIVSHDYRASPPDREGNLNRKRDYDRLTRLDLSETGSLGEFLDRLRALTHPPHANAYFETENGEKVFVEVRLSRAGDP